MAILIWTGAGITGLGLVGLVYCIVVAARARRAGLEGQEMTDKLRSLVAINLAALACSAIGLMMVIVGTVL